MASLLFFRNNFGFKDQRLRIFMNMNIPNMNEVSFDYDYWIDACIAIMISLLFVCINVNCIYVSFRQSEQKIIIVGENIFYL